MLEIGGSLGTIEKSGSWYSYQDTNLGQGSDNARLFLKTNSELAIDINEMIINAATRKKNGIAYDDKDRTDTLCMVLKAVVPICTITLLKHGEEAYGICPFCTNSIRVSKSE